MTRTATPVAMFVFARPETTARALDAVRAARPRRLLVVADGPRQDRPDEARRTEQVRALYSQIDWECELETNFASTNLGCRARVASGLDWVFARAEEAIIVEDDCVPHASFFPYCDALLARYRDESRVMAITGDNFQGGRRRGAGSYYFSRFVHVWGWASWRRAWRHYDVTMADWPTRRNTDWLERVLGNRRAARLWKKIFDRTWSGKIDTWDYQWLYAIWTNSGLVATPNVNLVANIGLVGTHTRGADQSLFNMRTDAIELPPVSPARLEADEDADRLVEESFHQPVLARVVDALSSMLRR